MLCRGYGVLKYLYDLKHLFDKASTNILDGGFLFVNMVLLNNTLDITDTRKLKSKL